MATASRSVGLALMVYQPQPKPLTEIGVVQHWFTELHRLVPPR